MQVYSFVSDFEREYLKICWKLQNIQTILEEYDKIVKMIVCVKSVFGADGDKTHCDLCFYSDCVLEKNVLSGIYGHC